jgi:hypothetical protein
MPSELRRSRSLTDFEAAAAAANAATQSLLEHGESAEKRGEGKVVKRQAPEDRWSNERSQAGKIGGKVDGPVVLPSYSKTRGAFVAWLGQRAEGGEGAEEGAEGKEEAPPALTREGSSENR